MTIISQNNLNKLNLWGEERWRSGESAQSPRVICSRFHSGLMPYVGFSWYPVFLTQQKPNLLIILNSTRIEDLRAKADEVSSLNIVIYIYSSLFLGLNHAAKLFRWFVKSSCNALRPIRTTMHSLAKSVKWEVLYKSGQTTKMWQTRFTGLKLKL